MRTKDHTGVLGEEHAAKHLVGLGFQMLDRRWRTRTGELDLVMRDGGVLVGVEVKTRRGVGYGHPLEAVTPAKLRRLHRLIAEYAAEHGLRAVPRRIDAVAVLLPPVRGARSSQTAPGIRMNSATPMNHPVIEHLRDVAL
ncbi:YraN family protein [Nesterenkonia flava]|uniref:UPF0102 protein RH857_06110 n=1 Tax=Nesterenkonia flava TaxID=469799 RepID=A0ABU1FTN9_9MICC|nr:YraN family protein [Nesterenkonia flava]MDR5711707.1 YraN family protein [Nesterenkonia flava]